MRSEQEQSAIKMFLTLVVVMLLSFLFPACGNDASRPATIDVTAKLAMQQDGEVVQTKTIACEGDCAQRQVIVDLMKTPPTDRICTQIYGGPEVINVSGRIDGQAVERMFKRTNGCEIADFDKATKLFGLTLPQTQTQLPLP
jgi:hypothetical protein